MIQRTNCEYKIDSPRVRVRIRRKEFDNNKSALELSQNILKHYGKSLPDST